MSPTVKLLQDSALIFGRSVREARRQAALSFFAPTFLSIAVVLIFEAVYGSIADVRGFPTKEFIEWVAPGAVFLSVFLGAGFTAGSVVRDARSGYLDRLRLLPTRPAALMIGRLAFDAVRALPPAAAVLGDWDSAQPTTEAWPVSSASSVSRPPWQSPGTGSSTSRL